MSLAEDHTPPQELLLKSQLLAVQADLRGLEAITDSIFTILHQQSQDRLEPTENGQLAFPANYPPLPCTSHQLPAITFSLVL